jgi:hypothetical protein
LSGKNNQEGKNLMRKLYVCLLAFIFALPIVASGGGPAFAKKKNSYKRSEFSSAQRARLMAEARKICRKKYGPTSTVYQLDYYKWRVVCTDY